MTDVPKAPSQQPAKTACSTCKIEKPYTEFNKTQLTRRLSKKSSATGNKGHCKDCVREMNMKRNYNMTEADFAKMLEQQNHKCAIEWCTEKLNKENANIDHNHYNKKVRGILCINCNTSIGGCGDSIEKILVIACYLTKTTDTLSIKMDASTEKSLKELAKWYETVRSKVTSSSSSTSSTSDSK